MANVLYDSYINPVKFHKLDNVQLDSYTSRFMDDWAFRRTIQPWEERKCFYQPWKTSDLIRLQYTSNAAPIVIRVYDENGVLKNTHGFTTLQQDELRPTFYIRQVEISLAALDPGKYFFTRDFVGGITYSEPFEILEDENLDDDENLTNQDPTILVAYSNMPAYQGIKFFTGFAPVIRVPAILKYKETAAKDNVYEDQLLNMTMINSVPFRVFDFIVGGNYGVPPYFIDKVARIHGCTTLQYDGRLFTKNEGASFEPTELEYYPMRGYRIEMREKLNRDSVITENENTIEGIAAAALLIDTKGFGLYGGDGSYQQINYLQ